MRISDWSSDVCSSDLDQAGKAHHNAAGHQRADVLANGAGGGAGDQDPDKQQYDASQHLDPFWPGHAPQRQRPKLAEQLGVLFLAGFLVRKHVYQPALRACNALPALLEGLWPIRCEIHWPISTTASRSIPVSMSSPRSMNKTSSVDTLPVAPLA